MTPMPPLRRRSAVRAAIPGRTRQAQTASVHARPDSLTLTLWMAALALLAAPVPGHGDEPPDRHPHVVILFVDDMGYGDPGCYNPDSLVPTPAVDSLARDGMRFTDAHAPGALCHTSRYGLITGRYPFRANPAAWSERPVIEPERMTLASLLRSRGYHTTMVGKWHLGFDESAGFDQPMPGGPVDLGFDRFFGMRASTDIPPYFYIEGDTAVKPPTIPIEANSTPGWSPIQGAFWREGLISPDMDLAEVLPRFTDESVAIIRDHAANRPDQPLLLYLALPAPHTPWLPTEPFDGVSGAGLYGDFMAMVDAKLGEVLDALDQAGMADDTLVIFTSDNGPVWYEEDTERLGHDSRGGLRGMKGDAHEGGHRMPFVVRWPGRVEPGVVSRQTISFTDLLATLAELTGANLPADAGEDSFSLLPTLLGVQPEDEPLRPPVISTAASGMRAVQQGRWKLIEGLGSGGFTPPRQIDPGPGDPPGQLYDLDDDPEEQRNLWQEQPDIVDWLNQVLEEADRDGRTRH